MSRIILHIDMNSYFASVEQQANPLLRGRPVGVCEHLGGIIIAPSVEAKRIGIKLGTPVWEAVKIFPQIALLHTDPDKYRHITGKFLSILRDYSDDVEQYSIDEAFVDITRSCGGDYREALLLGLEIKQRLRLEVAEWVSCSIGIGPNKIVSKIAADLDGGVILESRPVGTIGSRDSIASLQNDSPLVDRICVIRPDEVSRLYSYLSLTDVPGIGPQLGRALHKLGIFSLRMLAKYPLANLLNQFGIPGLWLHDLANFRDSSAVTTAEEPPKSFGHAYTVPRALQSAADIKKLMFKLAEKIGRRMRRHGARGQVVHYFHSDKQYSGFSKQRKIKEYIDDGKDIYRVAWGIYTLHGHSGANEASDRISRSYRRSVKPELLQDDKSRGVKIMGISVSGLKHDEPQDFLFEQYQRPVWLTRAMDRINDKYGDYTITRAEMRDAPDEWAKDTVGFRKMR